MFLMPPYRVLNELSEEAAARAPAVARQKKESEFLRQKAGQYQKLVASMKVRARNNAIYLDSCIDSNFILVTLYIHRRS